MKGVVKIFPFALLPLRPKDLWFGNVKSLTGFGLCFVYNVKAILLLRVALSTTTTNSTSSTMEADRVHLEVTMDNLHKEATTTTSSSTSSTMHTCSRNNRLCTTTLNMRCR